ncbi:MAG TPA: YdeI/OmpD-associated family protein [Flavobacteriales bacterium]|nr:YdeI/OmpD-associated family protein [Flavobacteriales bacterium]
MAKKEVNIPVEYSTYIDALKHLSSHYFELPPAIIKKLGGKMSIRLICTINKKISWQCGPMALGNGSAYITISAKRMKEIGVKPGDKIHVSLVKDESKYGMEVPAELLEVLKQDNEGKKRFDAMAMSKQRYVIQYVLAVKSSNLRIERSLLLIENLKKLKPGKESLREMMGLPPR